MSVRKISAVLTQDVLRTLHAGDRVELSGDIYTARDAAHKRFCDLLDAGKPLPVELRNSIIYFVGPSPAKPGDPIGSAGPTTSYRMDPYSPRLIGECGLTGMIGKGPRGQNVIDAMTRAGAVYFAAVGGAAALISRSVTAAEVVAYPDLGPEAVRRLTVQDMPLIVAVDSAGVSLYT
ncbi:MAG: Fe-S-containing hydro-lyase [Fibrobacterota bacterium]